MSFGFLRKLDHHFEVETLAKELQPAFKKGLEYCIKCGWCCVRRACVPSVEDMVKIALFLEITVKELISKYYIIDTLTVDNVGKVYFPRHANQKQTDLVGQFLSDERSFDLDKCIFQDDDYKCKIYSAKTKQAMSMECWNQGEDAVKEIDKRSEKMFAEWKSSNLLIDNGFDGAKMEEEEENRWSSDWEDDEEE